MEYQGIVAGIGNKEQNINLIMPEFDSAVNKYIIGKNTIIDGLELDGFTLSAGVCILNGVRGMLENKITLDIRDYVYGRFRKSLIGDTFHIVTSKTELTDDEYNKYLLLYENGISRISRDYPYPEHAKYANQSKVLGLNGVLDAGVTAQTLSVNAHETEGAQSKVATVRYVYNQIEKEIDFGETVVDFVSSNGSVIGSLELTRKSKYVIGVATINDTSLGGGNLTHSVWGVIPEKFRPVQPFYFCMNTYITPYIPIFREFKCETNGNISPTGVFGDSNSDKANSSVIGYECK